MFADAIENVGAYTRPFQTITKTYKSNDILRGGATFFFVNDEGTAVTTKHVAQELIARQSVEENYAKFNAAKEQLAGGKNSKAALKKLELEYGYHQNTATHAKTRFLDSFDTFNELTMHLHEHYDLAILQFKGFNELRYQGHAVFAAEDNYVRPGDFLCRLGFPFAEFEDYRFNPETDQLEWVAGEPTRAPRFPIDGMVTRFVADEAGVYGIELSTPGLRGQSGGPLFDEDEVVCGMQFATYHLHLGFDMEDAVIKEDGREKKINNQPFMHVGRCISARVIKDFLDQHDITYYIDE